MALFIIISLLILIFIAKYLIQRHLYACILILGGSQRLALLAYSLLFFIGVVVHEMAHFFMAALLGVRSGHISLFPDIWQGPVAGRIKMGSVQIEKTDFFRSSIVGAAPFLLGITLIVILTALFFDRLGIPLSHPNFIWTAEFRLSQIGWVEIGILYLLLSVSNTLFVSKEDTRSWPGLVIIFSLVALILVISGTLGQLSQSIYILLEQRLWQVAFALAFVTIIDASLAIGLSAFAWVLNRILKKRIIYA